jgi:hypothetical protein
MTPEELAAFEKWRQGKNIQSGVEYLIATAAWDASRAESAKEIASLKDKLFLAQKETSILRSWLGKKQMSCKHGEWGDCVGCSSRKAP